MQLKTAGFDSLYIDFSLFQFIPSNIYLYMQLRQNILNCSMYQMILQDNAIMDNSILNSKNKVIFCKVEQDWKKKNCVYIYIHLVNLVYA